MLIPLCLLWASSPALADEAPSAVESASERPGESAASGLLWGFQLQARYDFASQEHTVSREGRWGTGETEMRPVGGSSVTLGLYLGRAR